MTTEKYLIGEVFVSYSWTDKSFVTKLAKRIKEEGYSVWVDDHKLIAGDSVAEKISKALVNSKVVLVIISKTSIASKWLMFELNKATEMMIQGSCRVIPVVIEKGELPAAVEGLLYADFTISFRNGFKKVLSALKYETNKSADKCAFWQQIDILLNQVYGGRGFASIHGEYKDIDYETISLPIPFDNNDETEIAYETISAYSNQTEPLNEVWIKEFIDVNSVLGVSFCLVLSERPVDFNPDEICSSENRITLKQNKYYNELALNIVVIDMNDVTEKERRLDLIVKSKAYLTEKINAYKQLTGL